MSDVPRPHPDLYGSAARDAGLPDRLAGWDEIDEGDLDALIRGLSGVLDDLKADFEAAR